MKKDTFCPLLWTSVMIDESGAVYACCRKKPRKVGSIYKNTLVEIYNNAQIQALRKASLTGKLHCFSRCTYIKKDRRGVRPSTYTVAYSSLEKLQIQFGEMCNLQCSMCYQNSTNTECLEYELLIRNVDITPFRTIIIQGGEPLIIESARKFFDYAMAKGKKVSLLTNGMLIDDEWAAKIAQNSAFVYISINAATKKTHEAINRGSEWERVLANIDRVRQAKSYFASDIRIIGRMTIVPHNVMEIPLFIKNFRTLGFDSINFGYDAKMPYVLFMRPIRRHRLRMQIRTALDSSGDTATVDAHRLQLLGLV